MHSLYWQNETSWYNHISECPIYCNLQQHSHNKTRWTVPYWAIYTWCTTINSSGVVIARQRIARYKALDRASWLHGKTDKDQCPTERLAMPSIRHTRERHWSFELLPNGTWDKHSFGNFSFNFIIEGVGVRNIYLYSDGTVYCISLATVHTTPHLYQLRASYTGQGYPQLTGVRVLYWCSCGGDSWEG